MAMSEFRSLFLTVLLFISVLAEARVPVSELWAPDGYYWSEFHDEEERTLTLRLFTDKGEQTKIYYMWETDDLILLEQESSDDKLGVHTPAPGEHLWWAHPEAGMSVESFFVDNAKEVELKKPSVPVFVIEGKKITYSTFDDYLQEYEKQVSMGSIKEIRAEIEKKIHETYDRTLSEVKLDGVISRFLTDLDLIEPIHRVDEGRHRFDAFTMFPVLALEKYPDAFLRALRQLSKVETFYPIHFLVFRKDLPIEVRMGLVMLLTHNHLNEDYFTKAMIVEHGVRKAWDAALTINHLYNVERNYWRSNNLVRTIDGVEKVNPGDFRILPTINGGGDQWIAMAKTYHYYGAVLISARLRMEYGLPRTLLVDRAAQLMGLGYKGLSLGSRLFGSASEKEDREGEIKGKPGDSPTKILTGAMLEIWDIYKYGAEHLKLIEPHLEAETIRVGKKEDLDFEESFQKASKLARRKAFRLAVLVESVRQEMGGLKEVSPEVRDRYRALVESVLTPLDYSLDPLSSLAPAYLMATPFIWSSQKSSGGRGWVSSLPRAVGRVASSLVDLSADVAYHHLGGRAFTGFLGSGETRGQSLLRLGSWGLIGYSSYSSAQLDRQNPNSDEFWLNGPLQFVLGEGSERKKRIDRFVVDLSEIFDFSPSQRVMLTEALSEYTEEESDDDLLEFLNDEKYIDVHTYDFCRGLQQIALDSESKELTPLQEYAESVAVIGAQMAVLRTQSTVAPEKLRQKIEKEEEKTEALLTRIELLLTK